MLKRKMLNLFVTFAIFIALCGYCNAETYYVSKNGNDTNNGKSWGTSLLSINTALSKSVSVDNVWVAAGTYTEGSTIIVQNWISIYGGFNGSETLLSDRDTSANKTIIDGNNSYRCITNGGVIDGLYITKGKTSAGSGGGVYNYSGGLVKNCEIFANYSESGGGVYNYGEILNCSLYSNTATLTYPYSNRGGAGIYNESKGVVKNCKVYANDSEGIYNCSEGEVINCSVYSNKSYGIYNAGNIINSVVWKNNPCDVFIQDNKAKISNSCFAEATNTNGNIKSKPLFVNTTGDLATWDFHLQNGSVCIDSGTTETLVPSYDFENSPRPGNDLKIDMGAYESPDVYEQGTIQPKDSFFVNKSGLDIDGSSWNLAYTTINKAIEAAKINSDNLVEIQVAEGTYKEGKTLTIPSRISIIGGFTPDKTIVEDKNTTEAKTIIDGENKYLCFINYGTLDTLNITNGLYRAVNNMFSGVVNNCTIYHNYSLPISKYYDGGGIYNNRGIVSRSIIENNAGENGGGICNLGIVKDCILRSNIANKQGGGIISFSSGIIENCVIYGNTVLNNFNRGGGVVNDSASVINSIVYSNSAHYCGGIMNASTSGIVTNCTVYGNTSGYGAALGTYGYVTNTIAWNNTPQDIQQYDSTTLVFNSCFKESAGTGGNINQNPLFVNTAGDKSTWDFHLQETSPCIDKGTSTNAPDADLAGTVRPQGAGFDMGAYEYVESLAGNINMDGKIDLNDLLLLNGYICMDQSLTSQQIELCDFNQDGKTDISDIVALINSINAK